ncbi:STY4528 family pathogenicity island replication protein [Komagataeibacter nataicola]|uniref:STY4528 family pathogenicity island replication protein n=1 Tax=Komagataeibacter nataicola TaxID=265960 RepID=UPI0023DCFF3A|nr:STY4528 family pathogenicity island replication protein [Komagataeibacter nataicola]WEQ55767.1 STY4528 family pathogenicity island replication protein [Komagataeibacter nataicola]
MTRSRPPRGPEMLGALFDHALHRMQAERAHDRARPATVRADGLLFSGNRHDAVPRGLILDRRLTPLERNAWQVFRLLLNDDGVTAFPSYDELAPFLASMPGAGRASHETVARALTAMRLTRWISLARRRRDPVSGRVIGNLYVLHDEPLTPYEGIQLDMDYLDLVGRALTHASVSLQRIGMLVLKEITEDDALRHQILPTRLRTIAQRLSAQDGLLSARYPQDVDNPDSEEGRAHRLRNRRRPSSDSEVGPDSAENGSLRNPKTDRTVRKEDNKKIHTVRPVHRARGALTPPERFMTLTPEQQAGVLAALQAIDSALHQPILDEWDARCDSTPIRNPAGYLFGIVQKALRGEFRAWAGQRDSND